MKRFILGGLLILATVWATPAQAQTVIQAPDCVLGVTALTAVGTSQPFDNRGAGCSDWTLAYTTYGFSAATIQIGNAPNNQNAPGTFVAYQGTILGGVTFPASAGSSGTISVSGYYPYMNVSLVSKTGTGSFQGTLYGFRRQASAISSITVTPNSTYPAPFGIAIATLSATSATVATASTVLVGNMFFQNITSGAITVDVTNTAGTVILKAFSIPANSNLNLNFESGLLAVGIKWWASAVSSINASVTGWQ